MLYRIRSTGEVVNQGELRKRNTEISLPKNFNQDVLDFLEVDEVKDVPPPVTPEYKIAVQDGIEHIGFGQYQIKWKIVDQFSDILNENGEVVKTVQNQIDEQNAIKMNNTKKTLMDAIQKHLDGVAVSKGYDSIISMCSYSTSTDTVFGLDGKNAIAFRDAVWKKSIEIMNSVASGEIAVPTQEVLIGMLPEFGGAV